MYQDQTRWQTHFWCLFACAEVDVMETSLVSPLIANLFYEIFSSMFPVREIMCRKHHCERPFAGHLRKKNANWKQYRMFFILF